MTIDNNIYSEIVCFERHQLIPFSNSSSGAVTTVLSRLQLKGEESYSSGEFLAEGKPPPAFMVFFFLVAYTLLYFMHKQRTT